MVCLLCLHCKFSVFLPKMGKSAQKIENLVGKIEEIIIDFK